MKLNLNALAKSEIVWLSQHYCKHGHTYLNHYGCYLKEVEGQQEERVGVLDIESTGLDADFGFMLSYAILNASTGDVLGRVVTPAEVTSGAYDAELCKEIVKDIIQFDRIVGYYVADRRFDIPFIRSRCLVNNVDFPPFGAFKVTDVYDIVKSKMKLGRSNLKSACEFLDIGAKTHPLTGKHWMDARTGKKAGLDWVWKHNVEDVESTLKLWNKIKHFQRRTNKVA